MSPFSYAVIANCQARPISTAIDYLSMHTATNVGMVITHLAKHSEADANMELLAKADFIFAQSVQQSYPVKYVVTDALKREFADKVISWPNMFFTGHSPGLCYVTGAGCKRIVGPLHEYQYRPVFESWQQGASVDECLRKIEAGIDQDSLWQGVEKSFDELRAREQDLDVIASDLIEQDWKKKRLFFTFNHPSSNLLIQVARRLMEKAGIPTELKITSDIFGEPLSRIVPPISDADASTLGLGFDTSLVSKGVELSIADGKVSHGKSRIYFIRELIDESYRALDAQTDLIKDIRFTPA